MVEGMGGAFGGRLWAYLTVVVAAVVFAGSGDVHRLSAQGGATPVAIDFEQLVGERPAEIVEGDCEEPGEPVAILTTLTTPEGEALGQGQAIEAERSYTAFPVPITDLLAGQTSVRVLLSADQREVAVACGEIGGVPSEGGSIVVKLSERDGSGFTGIAFLAPDEAGGAGVSVFLGGTRTVAETRELAAATPQVELEGVAAPTPTTEPIQVVDIALLEWAIDAPADVRAGQINFVVTNEGAEPHRLVIEAGGVIVAELAAPVQPDESAVLSAALSEGEYVLYCPLGDGEHRAEGMEVTLTVTP